MDKISILGVDIDNLYLREAMQKIDEYIAEGRPSLVVTANPEIIMRAREDKGFSDCLDKARMITADGIGIVVAAKLLGHPMKERVCGIDLVTALFEKAKTKRYRFYFVGAKPGVAEKAARNVREKYPDVDIVGIHHGYFHDDAHIIKDIEEKKPDILLAALGMGKQENWIMERVYKTGVPVSIGVGGSFDVLAGEAKRAPLWMRNVGLEWLYRLIKQPSRLGRMMQLPKFLIIVALKRVFKS